MKNYNFTMTRAASSTVFAAALFALAAAPLALGQEAGDSQPATGTFVEEEATSMAGQTKPQTEVKATTGAEPLSRVDNDDDPGRGGESAEKCHPSFGLADIEDVFRRVYDEKIVNSAFGELQEQYQSLRRENDKLNEERCNLEEENKRLQSEKPELAVEQEEVQARRRNWLPWAVLTLQICVVVMLAALGFAIFGQTRDTSAYPSPRKPEGGDAPADWRKQLDDALNAAKNAQAAELRAREDVESAKASERQALSDLRAAREAASAAEADVRTLRASADSVQDETRQLVHAAVAAFASSDDVGEETWLRSLRDIARGISKFSASRGDTPKETLALLAKWSRTLQDFESGGREFSLTLPSSGASVDSSWMTAARSGTATVSRVVTWAVYGKNGIRHNAEVE